MQVNTPIAVIILQTIQRELARRFCEELPRVRPLGHLTFYSLLKIFDLCIYFFSKLDFPICVFEMADISHPPKSPTLLPPRKSVELEDPGAHDLGT